jgi:hypothetical protein
MMIKPVWWAIGALSAFALVPGVASADSPAVTLTTPGEFYDSADYTIGFEFTVSSPQSIEALGVYDDGGAALPTNASVGLWNSSGDLLASATVPASGGVLIGDFRYSNISAFSLTPGTDYIVGAYLGGSGVATSLGTGQGGTGSYSPLITVVEDQFITSSTLSFPSSTDGHAGGVWLGANFELASAVPEPSTWALMLLGFAGLSFAAYRRSKKSRTGFAIA